MIFSNVYIYIYTNTFKYKNTYTCIYTSRDHSLTHSLDFIFPIYLPTYLYICISIHSSRTDTAHPLSTNDSLAFPIPSHPISYLPFPSSLSFSIPSHFIYLISSHLISSHLNPLTHLQFQFSIPQTLFSLKSL